MSQRIARRVVMAVVVAVTGVIAIAAQDSKVARYDKVNTGAYAVVAEIRAKPGKERALRDATLSLVAAVRAEPNNLLYFLHEDRESPGHFIFYEIFARQADFEAHNATPHVQSWFAKLPELAEGPVKVIRMEILGNSPAR